MRILAVAELGANWGHLLRLLPVIRALRARGHVVRLAAANVAAARSLLSDEPVEIVQCPGALVNVRVPAKGGLDAYAGILDQCVFGSDAALALTLQQWDECLAAWPPDAVLTDFAPGALLVARLHRLPLVQLATGWEAPPPGALLPIIRPWRQVNLRAVEMLEATLLARLNSWCAKFAVEPLHRLSDLYATGTQLLAVLAETDHFAPRAEANYIGPIFAADFGERVDWPAARGRVGSKVLVYLAPDRRNPVILHALGASGAQVVAVLPGTAEIGLGLMPNVRVQRGPLQLAPLLRDADLVIGNAGHGMSAASLLAGIPMMVLPLNVEQAIITGKLVATGAVVSLLDGMHSRGWQARIREAMASDVLRAAARTIAAKYEGVSQSRTVSTVVHAVEQAGAAMG
ncbi:glycosyltransferase [Variovorax sp. RB2P76]|uniref:glycosyltransferase n=1 Tax=Variovorax sp. RB2P76 TaxID=3443736 RepID=UPI003F484EA4